MVFCTKIVLVQAYTLRNVKICKIQDTDGNMTNRTNRQKDYIFWGRTYSDHGQIQDMDRNVTNRTDRWADGLNPCSFIKVDGLGPIMKTFT